MPEEYRFTINEDIPSKKNSYRISINSGVITYIRGLFKKQKIPKLKELIKDLSKFARLRPLKAYRDWEENTVRDLIRQTTSNLFLGKVEIEFKIYFPRLGRGGGDIDNKMTSILDALTKSGIIMDDSYNCVTSLLARGIYRKNKGGADIILKDLTED